MRRISIPDASLLDDLKNVARQLNRVAISQTDYSDLGKYSFITVCRRFGSWKAALAAAGLEPAHWMNISADQLLADIQRVAGEGATTRLRFSDYMARGNYSRKIINRLFGRWQTAAEVAGLVPVIHRPKSRQDLFDNLAALGTKLGRRVRYDDLRGPDSLYSPAAYELRFGKFSNAMLEFEQSAHSTVKNDTDKCGPQDRSRGFARRTPRTINLRLRFDVLRRDRFRCCTCGRSPAADANVELQVDHKIPWSQGGETVMENLQTLCRECNRGKTDGAA